MNRAQAMVDPRDPVALTQALIRCPSVTPVDAGALDVLETALKGLGFSCHRLRFAEAGAEAVDNLYARIGDRQPNFCFAGHTDVVPAGSVEEWSADPFAATLKDGVVLGRGAADMKGAIAAFVAAAAGFIDDHGGKLPGSISLLITGDEEGVAINGTRKVLDWMQARGEAIDACVVGEPSNPRALGDMIKIGRRGSLNAEITVLGARGHVAYPQLADNPIPRLIKLLDKLISHRLDEGTAQFDPSNLEVTSIDVGNPAVNVIPSRATARLNIRFNDRHSAASLTRWLQACCAEAGVHELKIQVSGEAFLTAPGLFTDVVAGAVETVTGRRPELSTSGGTSDARFIKDMCAVVEFGAVGETMHKTDERIAVADLDTLRRIYRLILERYFAG